MDQAQTSDQSQAQFLDFRDNIGPVGESYSILGPGPVNTGCPWECPPTSPPTLPSCSPRGAVEPKALVVYSRMNGDCKLIVQDSSSLCSEGEEVSYATLQLGAQAVDQVLLGYRKIPEKEEAIVSVLNPAGADMRVSPRVWNAGDNRIKLITYQSSTRKEAGKTKHREKEGVTEENATEKNALDR